MQGTVAGWQDAAGQMERGAPLPAAAEHAAQRATVAAAYLRRRAWSAGASSAGGSSSSSAASVHRKLRGQGERWGMG